LIDLVAYVTYFPALRRSIEPAFERVKADIQRLVAASEENMKKGLVPQEDYDHARFAVFAWIDEMILASAWDQRELWQREQLQRIHYNTTDAGEKFYERLAALGAHQREVREIYYLCLALGVKGRHFNDEYALEQLKTSSLKLLMGSSWGFRPWSGGALPRGLARRRDRHGEPQAPAALLLVHRGLPRRAGRALRPFVCDLHLHPQPCGGKLPAGGVELMKESILKILKVSLMASVVVLVVLLVFGLVLLMGWPWWVALFLLLLVAGLVIGGVTIWKVWARRREKRFVQEVLTRTSRA
jgi:type IV/VI secretion system ImpK/VasF family protein